jgi:N-acetyl-anhydromuramyl-L-alanine amidase AmpD
MAFRNRLKKALDAELPGRVDYMPGWRKIRRVRWAGKTHRPKAVLWHHTAGAPTESTNPAAAGNQVGADDGVVNFIQNHYRVPAANATVTRAGRVVIHSAYPVWHAGLGSFNGKKPWRVLGIPKNRGNDYLFGVEVVSKGRRKDFTPAQIDAIGKLQAAVGEASKWPMRKRLAIVRRPRHKDYTDRKIDILYSQKEMGKWMSAASRIMEPSS